MKKRKVSKTKGKVKKTAKLGSKLKGRRTKKWVAMMDWPV